MTDKPDLGPVKAYFDQRLREYGSSPRGADWNSAEAQRVRFAQLLKVAQEREFSILDYGCGTGALADYLIEQGYQAEYSGFDILEGAIALARQLHADHPRFVFLTRENDLHAVDYTIASGVFNIRGNQPIETWTDYILATLGRFHALSRKGFASNFLTSYSDPERMRADLYYGDPLFFFDYCKRNFSKNVALLHDYNLYDFTLIVRKD